MNPLTFSQLRKANIKRLPKFKNRLGGPAHSRPDGSDWAFADWMVAVMGELGELASDFKSLKRGDFNLLTEAEIKQKLAHEMADVVTYLDILAMRVGVDLGQAVVDKFNIVSERVQCDVFLSNWAED